jgi:outer membrane usher protein FimD/PapC
MATAASDTLQGEGTNYSYQWGVSGGIGYVADTFSFSRPINDSFAVVDVGDVEGVRVYMGGQELGRTDREGRVFLPNLGSYRVNRVTVDDRDLPMDISVETNEVNTSPPLRSGSLISFDVKKFHAVSGELWLHIGGLRRAAEYVDLSVDMSGNTVTTSTGRRGEFYLENVPPARYFAHFDFNGRRCEFELVVPDSAEMIVMLGEIHACEILR